VLGAFLIQMVGFGAIYSSSAFSTEIAASLGMDRADTDLVMVLSLGGSFLVSAISGSLADRFGPRPLAVFGMILVAAGLAVAALSQNNLTLFLGYGLLLGLGVGLANVPSIAAVQRWFLTRRCLAAGIAGTGMAVGVALVPILKGFLSAIGDWRAIFLCCAALVALIGLAAALLLDGQSERYGMGPDGTRLSPANAMPLAQGVGLGQVLRMRNFHYAVVGTLLVSIPASAPLMLLVGSAEAQGLSHYQAVGLLALIGMGSLAGRLLLAFVADRLGRRISFLLTCFALGLAMFAWLGARDASALGAFALIYGVLQGSFVALLPAFAADSFGSRSIGGLIGALYTSRGLALLLGMPLVSTGIAFFGTYDVAIVICGLAGLLGAFLLTLPRVEVTVERKARPAKSRQLALALWFLALLGCGVAMPALSPRAVMAEALAPDTTIRAANLPATQARSGALSFAAELASGTGVFDVPEAAAQPPVPAALILHGASSMTTAPIWDLTDALPPA
jgi:OFA family oxalate/formate antiporter-like MFS transporter